MILKDHRNAPIRKERLSPSSKARREANRNKFVEKSGMPYRVKSFREIDSRQDRPRARPGFVKPIQNGLRKEQNLIKCRPSMAETGLARRENGIRFQKKSRRDRMMRSNSFETQEVGEIGLKEAGESRGFPILCMGIIKDVFQMEGKECEDQERLKMWRRKSMPERGRCFSMR